jgi:peptidoglycan/LPS O-acetylase OafA/YrhL
MLKAETLASGLRLRRVTSGGRFIPEIDGLRFIAIASVVLYHTQLALFSRFSVVVPQELLSRLVGNGFRGVELFFVISGFILGLPFAAHSLMGRETVQLKKYFLRRLTRLEPPYILSMLVIFGILCIHHQYWPSLVRSLGASLLYMHNLIFAVPSKVNGVAWSLEVEIQFYCLVPLLAAVFRIQNRYCRRAVLVFAMVGAATAQVLWLRSQRLELSILCYIQFFLAGFLLADVYLTDWKSSPSRHWAWDIGSLAWLFVFWVRGPWFSALAFPFLAFALYCVVFRGILTRWILTLPAITNVGGMCYTIYLWHWHVVPRVLGRAYHVGLKLGYPAYLFLQVLIFLPFLAIVSVLLYKLIEQPCMDRSWPTNLWTFVRGMLVTQGTGAEKVS